MRWSAAALAAALVVSPGLQADALTLLPAWQRAAGVLFEDPAPGWTGVIGAGGEYGPTRDGGTRRTAIGFPFVDLRWKDRAFISVAEGLGANLLRGEHWRAGLAVNWAFGSNGLNGAGRVPSGPYADAFAEARFAEALFARLDLRRGFIRDTGTELELGGGAALPLIGESLVLFAGPSLVWQDGAAARRRWSVDAAQAAAGGLPAFSAQSGLAAAGIGFTLAAQPSPSLLVEAYGGWRRLLGDAAASPVARVRQGAAFGLIVAVPF